MNGMFSNVSIRLQILLGYVPVLIILIMIAFLSYQHNKSFVMNFENLSGINQNNLTFLEIEQDILALQRNVLVYSYIGYNGVIKKIELLESELDEKFEMIAKGIQGDDEIEDRFNRMRHHYIGYKQDFRQVRVNKEELSILQNELLNTGWSKANKALRDITQTLVNANRHQVAYQASRIQQKLYAANLNIMDFLKSPDYSLMRKTNHLLHVMEKDAAGLNVSSELKDSFLVALADYKKKLGQFTRKNRSYIYLINVVLAGKAAEIDKLSKELDKLVKARSDILSEEIQNSSTSSRRNFMVLSITAGLLGIVASLLIAFGIAEPVTKMADTLSLLAKGKADVEIPGQQRKDEVGKMAKAANDFKAMALDLENQSKELEEFAYRTSHDLRSPLVSSIGLLEFAEQSLKDTHDVKVQKSISLVKASLTKLESLVKDILQINKTKNELEKPTQIDYEKIISESVAKFSSLEHFDQLDILFDIDITQPVYSLKSRIKLIIENLLSNAIKYQDPEQENSFIKLSVKEDNDVALITIEDNGLGIPKEQQQQLFAMFKRFHPKVSFGSGLGMYMIKKSVDILNGEIQYEDPGQGTKFILKIPMNHEVEA